MRVVGVQADDDDVDGAPLAMDDQDADLALAEVERELDQDKKWEGDRPGLDHSLSFSLPESHGRGIAATPLLPALPSQPHHFTTETMTRCLRTLCRVSGVETVPYVWGSTMRWLCVTASVNNHPTPNTWLVMVEGCHVPCLADGWRGLRALAFHRDIARNTRTLALTRASSRLSHAALVFSLTSQDDVVGLDTPVCDVFDDNKGEWVPPSRQSLPPSKREQRAAVVCLETPNAAARKEEEESEGEGEGEGEGESVAGWLAQGLEKESSLGVEEVCVVVGAIAALHSKYWNHPSLIRLSEQGLMGGAWGGGAWWDNALSVFRASFADVVSPLFIAAATAVPNHLVEELVQGVTVNPSTMCHNNLTPQLLTVQAERPLARIEGWDCCGVGSPALDLAMAIAFSLQYDEASVTTVLEAYATALGCGGVAQRERSQDKMRSLYHLGIVMGIVKSVAQWVAAREAGVEQSSPIFARGRKWLQTLDTHVVPLQAQGHLATAMQEAVKEVTQARKAAGLVRDVQPSNHADVDVATLVSATALKCDSAGVDRHLMFAVCDAGAVGVGFSIFPAQEDFARRFCKVAGTSAPKPVQLPRTDPSFAAALNTLRGLANAQGATAAHVVQRLSTCPFLTLVPVVEGGPVCSLKAFRHHNESLLSANRNGVAVAVHDDAAVLFKKFGRLCAVAMALGYDESVPLQGVFDDGDANHFIVLRSPKLKVVPVGWRLKVHGADHVRRVGAFADSALDLDHASPQWAATIRFLTTHLGLPFHTDEFVSEQECNATHDLYAMQLTLGLMQGIKHVCKVTREQVAEIATLAFALTDAVRTHGNGEEDMRWALAVELESAMVDAAQVEAVMDCFEAVNVEGGSVGAVGGDTPRRVEEVVQEMAELRQSVSLPSTTIQTLSRPFKIIKVGPGPFSHTRWVRVDVPAQQVVWFKKVGSRQRGAVPLRMVVAVRQRTDTKGRHVLQIKYKVPGSEEVVGFMDGDVPHFRRSLFMRLPENGDKSMFDAYAKHLPDLVRFFANVVPATQ